MKGEIAVRYTIRHFDLPLLTFEANIDSADTGLHFIKVYEENRSFLPLNLTVSEDGVERWLRHRAIPKNRAYVDALLSKVGLSLNRPLGIIAANKGLSLNDCFWVDAEGSGDTFEKVNAVGMLAGFAAQSGATSMAIFASTGTAISSLSGAAATNATLAQLGGGALSAGGLGMAGGQAVLTGLTAAPLLWLKGFFLISKEIKFWKTLRILSTRHLRLLARCKTLRLS